MQRRAFLGSLAALIAAPFAWLRAKPVEWRSCYWGTIPAQDQRIYFSEIHDSQTWVVDDGTEPTHIRVIPHLHDGWAYREDTRTLFVSPEWLSRARDLWPHASVTI